MPTARYPLLFLQGPTRSGRFTSPQQGGSSIRLCPRDRATHAAYISNKLQDAWQTAEERQAVAHAERHGVYLDFYSEPGFDLSLKSLDAQGSGIRLLNVRKNTTDSQETTIATVFVPNTKRTYFLRKVEAYATEQVPNIEGVKPKNAKLVESISDVRLSVLQSFWQDSEDLLPADEPDWIEAWVSSAEPTVVNAFETLCRQLGIQVGEDHLTFPERTVCLIRANRQGLSRLVTASDSIAEFRAANEVATYFIDRENQDQSEMVQTLLARLDFHNHDKVAVLILDQGVNNGHSLLQPILANVDLHTVNPDWGKNDHGGHGTLMAGTVGYGDILELLNGHHRVVVSHSIESAKILPPPPASNPKQLWGRFTEQGVSRAEIQAPLRKRIICLAVTATETRQGGRPSSWSGTLDELASGYGDNIQRLIIVSAGNVNDSDEWLSYPDANLTNDVHDPAQSWNALSIGAYTNKVRITDPMLRAYTPVADAGNLSPFSTTSLTWDIRQWPIKPEVLFEGGNVARGPSDGVFPSDDLSLLSTYHDPQVTQFAAFNATSAASAQAAWMAARIQAAYPDAWPETIRALIVHTATWTEAQKRQFLLNDSKASYAKLLRICGYGVPNLERALSCAKNTLTLIAQQRLQPFDRHAENHRHITRDFHFYRLPWPEDVLYGLGETPVEMRITLSYFVEPSPGEIGWKDRYRYASHALRFALNSPTESEQEFVRRINAHGDEEPSETEGPRDHWVIGGNARNVGSIHSDIWQGTAAELAASNLIAVHPAVGWWRERHHLGRWNRKTRYSLIVSIQTPTQDVDIYTPVAVQIGIPVPISIS